MSHKAKQLNAYLLAGSFVEKEGDHYYNTSLFFDNAGKLVGRYRKIHLFGYGSAETELLTPGREMVTVATDLGVFGLSTCYDLRFPELYRSMLDQGAEYFLVTSAWPYPRLEHWTILNQARAIENSAYLFSSNCCGVQKGSRYLGHSMLVDPWGTPLASAGMHEAIVTTQVDPAEVSRIRREFPPVADRVILCKEQIWKEKEV
jgi:predicted amidohydrolase